MLISIELIRNSQDEFNILLSAKLIRMSQSRSAFYAHHRWCFGLAVKKGRYLSLTPYRYCRSTTASARVRFAVVLAQLPFIQNFCRRFLCLSLAQFSLYNRPVRPHFYSVAASCVPASPRPAPLFFGLIYWHKVSLLAYGFNYGGVYEHSNIRYLCIHIP